ncbi:MAG: hypothetical protein WDN28_31165 [Chthoniobacter sp.]
MAFIGRANLVAHVREEFGLGAAGRFGGRLGALADIHFREQGGIRLRDLGGAARVVPKKRGDERGEDEPGQERRRAIARKARRRGRPRSA